MLKAEFHVSRVIRLLKQRDDFPDPQEILLLGAHHLSFVAAVPESVGENLAGSESFDPNAIEELADDLRVVLDAARWLRFWADLGHRMWAWY